MEPMESQEQAAKTNSTAALNIKVSEWKNEVFEKLNAKCYYLPLF